MSTVRRPGGIAIDGGTIVIGSPLDGPDGDGVVRVFQHDGAEWGLSRSFDGCPNRNWNRLGVGSLARAGAPARRPGSRAYLWSGPDPDAPSFAVIGAPFQGPGNEQFGGAQGAAYLSWNDGGAWTEVSQLPWPGPLTSDAYGAVVTATGESAFVYQTGGPSPGESGANITVHDVDLCEP